MGVFDKLGMLYKKCTGHKIKACISEFTFTFDKDFYKYDEVRILFDKMSMIGELLA